MAEDKWIYDIKAEELINLTGLKGVCVYTDRAAHDGYSAKYTLAFTYIGAHSYYLNYENSKLLHNAFEHYTRLLNAKELDVSEKPLSL